MAEPYRILAVCTGNICRSPMAEYLLRKALERAGLGERVEVSSAGLSDEEVGNPIDPRADRVLKRHGIDASAHRARQMRGEDASGYDLVLALDEGHLDRIRRAYGRAGLPAHVRMLRAFDPKADPASLGIVDPWYGDAAGFDDTHDEIAAAVPGIVEHVRKELAARG